MEQFTTTFLRIIFILFCLLIGIGFAVLPCVIFNNIYFTIGWLIFIIALYTTFLLEKDN